MPKKLTKIVKNKRVMRSLRANYCLQKSTPDQWFSDHTYFLEHLFGEMGFQCEQASELRKPRGNKWRKEMTFSHSSGVGPRVKLLLERERRQEGGDIHVFLKRDLDEMAVPNMCFVFSTLANQSCKFNPHLTYDVQSKQDLGDKLISLIRDKWQDFDPPPSPSSC